MISEKKIVWWKDKIYVRKFWHNNSIDQGITMTQVPETNYVK